MTRRILMNCIITGLVLIGCQANPELDNTSANAIQTVGLQLIQYEGDAFPTKTIYDTGGNGKFLWASGDVVGIISSEGNQMMFPIRDQFFGEEYAEFDGRGFSLMSNSTYYSYYPFQANYNLDATAVDICYEGQVQSGNNSMAHLGSHSFTKATGLSPETGTLNFIFRNVGSPHRYRMPVIAGEYTHFSVSVSSAKYIHEGTIDLTSESVAITPSRLSKEFDLQLTNTAMGNGEQLRMWMMLPPADLSAETIRLYLTLADGSQLVAAVAGRDCPANSRRVFNALTSAYPVNSEVLAEGGNVTVKLIRSSESDAVVVTSDSAWLTETASSTAGLVTTYTFTAAENVGAERTATISFAETSTGLTNMIHVKQTKAGSIIGIGSWDSENHQGTAN